MSAAAAVRAGRVAAERNMLDTCTVHTPTGITTNPLTGVVTPTLTLTYTGKCKIQTYEAYERTPEVGGAMLTIQRYHAHVPVGSFVPEIDQVLTVTLSAMEPLLVGRTFRVASLLHKSAATAYRLGVEVIV